jgi:hypothetical protein
VSTRHCWQFPEAVLQTILGVVVQFVLLRQPTQNPVVVLQTCPVLHVVLSTHFLDDGLDNHKIAKTIRRMNNITIITIKIIVAVLDFFGGGFAFCRR